MQCADGTLDSLWRSARPSAEALTGSAFFLLENGLLHHRWHPGGDASSPVDQLVLPSFHSLVLISCCSSLVSHQENLSVKGGLVTRLPRSLRQPSPRPLLFSGSAKPRLFSPVHRPDRCFRHSCWRRSGSTRRRWLRTSDCLLQSQVSPARRALLHRGEGMLGHQTCSSGVQGVLAGSTFPRSDRSQGSTVAQCAQRFRSLPDQMELRTTSL